MAGQERPVHLRYVTSDEPSPTRRHTNISTKVGTTQEASRPVECLIDVRPGSLDLSVDTSDTTLPIGSENNETLWLSGGSRPLPRLRAETSTLMQCYVGGNASGSDRASGVIQRLQ
ncbi:uncharacterized protein PG986_009420 [Apiospora aurea]|uniref:Uncharacterized protein n=1 Tax=Apiospora aurea TaxID=335848 RepID=A0ABR1Q7N9_9PEZI